jgi:hypothetical protein
MIYVRQMPSSLKVTIHAVEGLLVYGQALEKLNKGIG